MRRWTNAQQAVAVLDENGVQHEGVKDIGAGWILEFRDPDNIALELFAPKAGESCLGSNKISSDTDGRRVHHGLQGRSGA